MSTQKPKPAAVRRGMLEGKTVPEALSILDGVCSTGAQCPQVQSSPVTLAALGVLQKAVTTTHATLSSKQELAQALMTVIKALRSDFGETKAALGIYEAAVGAVAKGDAKVINEAGLLSRDPKALPAALDKVAWVRTRPGKHPKEAILNWPPGPGATGYAIEVSFTPQDANGAWIALVSGAGRRRVVKGPTPGCQMLARVASLGSNGTQSEWSDAILATAL